MHPAWSVILLTTLIGAGQGLFVALAAAEAFGRGSKALFVAGALLALVLLGGGLVASFFHLGRPERAWRSAAKWRTSWLSREVIVLPAFGMAVAAWGAAHWLGGPAQAAAAAGVVLVTAAPFAQEPAKTTQSTGVAKAAKSQMTGEVVLVDGNNLLVRMQPDNQYRIFNVKPDRQFIIETAVLQAFGDPVGRIAPGDQYAIGGRYQVRLGNAWILRTDAMHGWLENSNDIDGARIELRHKC